MPSKLMEGRKSQDWINLVLAICLFISPWVIGFTAAMVPAWNAWIVGVALGALALATLSVFAEWEEWVNVVLGLWLIVSPWLLGFAADRNVMLTHVVLGVLVVAASAWAVWDFRHPHAHA
ncbi:SPW repeat protein [Mesorhizobium captivum]|uniref:SPW repeat protein n=1 Tax=Mesorhizobium captivum TaxID=3072319 RepID=A0ABU4Z1N7_9HYPH|nr:MULTISPECIES: SPW repeat protein [unclassified Mesorhizobium]MDX8449131.1 SPW repeat protein [Mesorhizobium sp. VK3C]MDX8492245.1 SPW repeat protein [Mesorhizobium sp. VK22B]MDX8506283.1 SPW repeat protein [Mesorhizobium sp. VK22E]MDX8515544.1 SPW repeat protein [Mesorhizobium sp. VK23E]